MIYTSKKNQIIKEIASLKDKKFRKLYNAYITEGIKTVNEAILNNVPIKCIVSTSSSLKNIAKNDYPLLEVSDEVFSYISDETNPQGVLAIIGTPSLSLQKPKGNALLLEGVSDPGNLGTIIRTAVAFGYKDIYLVNTVDPYNSKTVRATMSGIFFVNLYKGELYDVLSCLSEYKIIVADMKGEDIYNYTENSKHCICMGSEANGISNELKDRADKILKINMCEQSESLNVAVACAIMMYKLKNN